jgi:hypothetical protein
MDEILIYYTHIPKYIMFGQIFKEWIRPVLYCDFVLHFGALCCQVRLFTTVLTAAENDKHRSTQGYFWEQGIWTLYWEKP